MLDRFLCAFSHIFAGGYSCGYYSYKWAEVLSADAFGAWEGAGLENEAAVGELGQRFRDTVLACGGGTPPAEVFGTFRGRKPSPEALIRHSGLADESLVNIYPFIADAVADSQTDSSAAGACRFS